jgi:hypothetical protein
LHGALQDEGLFQSGVRYHLVLRSDAKHRVSKDEGHKRGNPGLMVRDARAALLTMRR